MATSGSTSANGGGNATWASTTLEVWRNWVDVGSNASSIHYKLSIYRGYEVYSSASKSYSVSVNGQTVASGSTTVGGSGTKVIAEGDITVYHNADGSKWLDFSFSQQWDVTLSNTWVGTMSNSSGFWLDSIARASQPSGSDPDGWYWYGEQITIYTNRASTAFTHTLRYSWHSESGTIATGVTDSYTWTIPKSFMNYIPNKDSSWGTVYCDTYNGGTLIGTKSFEVYTAVPYDADCYPTFTTISHSENVSLVSTSVGAYVKSLSKLNLSITGASGAYSSTISSQKITLDGATYDSGSVSNVLQNSGTLTITGTVTDSRGRVTTKSVTITVLDYSPPKVTALTPIRANSNGTANQLGTYINVTRTGTVSSLKNGTTEKNILKYTIKTKLRSDTVWTTNKALTQISGLSLTGNETLTQGTFDITKSYDIRLEITDLFNTTIALGVISSGQVTMSWGRTGIGVGKVWESGALDVGGDVNVTGNISVTSGKVKEDGNAIVPTGILQMYVGSTAPSGFLLCQGQAISRSTYSSLFAVIGTTYGAGDGSTTFNLPDFRARFPVGLSANDSEFNGLGKWGGEKSHVLTNNEAPPHDHFVKFNNGLGISLNGGNPTAWQGYNLSWGTNGYGGELITNSQGGGQAHNNLPPFMTVNFIIKY